MKYITIIIFIFIILLILYHTTYEKDTFKDFLQCDRARGWELMKNNNSQYPICYNSKYKEKCCLKPNDGIKCFENNGNEIDICNKDNLQFDCVSKNDRRDNKGNCIWIYGMVPKGKLCYNRGTKRDPKMCSTASCSSDGVCQHNNLKYRCWICNKLRSSECGNINDGKHTCTENNVIIKNSNTENVKDYVSYLNNNMNQSIIGKINCDQSSQFIDTTLTKCNKLANTQDTKSVGIYAVPYSPDLDSKWSVGIWKGYLTFNYNNYIIGGIIPNIRNDNKKGGLLFDTMPRSSNTIDIIERGNVNCRGLTLYSNGKWFIKADNNKLYFCYNGYVIGGIRCCMRSDNRQGGKFFSVMEKNKNKEYINTIESGNVSCSGSILKDFGNKTGWSIVQNEKNLLFCYQGYVQSGIQCCTRSDGKAGGNFMVTMPKLPQNSYVNHMGKGNLMSCRAKLDKYCREKNQTTPYGRFLSAKISNGDGKADWRCFGKRTLTGINLDIYNNINQSDNYSKVPELKNIYNECVAPLPKVSNCFNEYNIDYPGNDLKQIQNVSSAEKCAEICASTNGCKSFTYKYNKPGGNYKMCFLKSVVKGNRRKNTCCISGLPCKPAKFLGAWKDPKNNFYGGGIIGVWENRWGVGNIPQISTILTNVTSKGFDLIERKNKIDYIHRSTYMNNKNQLKVVRLLDKYEWILNKHNCPYPELFRQCNRSGQPNSYCNWQNCCPLSFNNNYYGANQYRCGTGVLGNRTSQGWGIPGKSCKDAGGIIRKIKNNPPWYVCTTKKIPNNCLINKHKVVISNNQFKLRTLAINKFIGITKDYCLEFEIKPLGVINTWSSIIHFNISYKDCCNQNDRCPGIWFIPNTTRLHCRAATSRTRNDGINTKINCPINKFTKVKIIGNNNKFTVKLYDENNNLLSDQDKIQSGNRGQGRGKVYVSDPWYRPANAIIKNIIYYRDKNIKIDIPPKLTSGTPIYWKPFNNNNLAVSFPRGYQRLNRNNLNQVFEIKKGGKIGGSVLGNPRAWYNRPNQTLKHQDIVSIYNPRNAKSYDCAWGPRSPCSMQPFPPPGGNWGTPYRIYSLNGKPGEIIRQNSPIYFDRMWQNRWNTGKSLNCNTSRCKGLNMNQRSLFQFSSTGKEMPKENCRISVRNPGRKVYQLGRVGISPWGGRSARNFDRNAQWIWNVPYARGPAAANIKIEYKYNFCVDRNMMARLRINIDNMGRIYINNRFIAQYGGGWGGNSGNFRIPLKEGKNQIKVLAWNMGGGPNPAGLVATIYDDRNRPIVNTNRNWTW